jgi:Di-haem cytochrome c peroxidase
MSTLRSTLFLTLGLIVGAGCVTNIAGPGSGDDTPPPPPPGQTDPPPVKPPPPAPAVYKRGSLAPLYELTPRAEYGKYTDQGAAMTDADFIDVNNNFTTAAQKMDEIGAQIGRERGGAAVTVITRAEDKQRSTQIPFRGNPSDVKLISVGGVRKAYVPLGGDLMTPGNEVASVNLSTGQVIRIKVGIRPQRVAVHPDGLIFVCNQYSNYITIIDPTTDTVLKNAQGPVEIKTEYYCSDLAFTPTSAAVQDNDRQDLYVANDWRGSVLKYSTRVIRDGLTNLPVDVQITDPVNPTTPNQPTAEITGVGANPYRLSVGQDLRSMFVANNRGGEIAKVDLTSRSVKRIAVTAPVPIVVQANDILLGAEGGPQDRGYPAIQEKNLLSNTVTAAPVSMRGIDGNQHIAHPGSQYDTTFAYNFEDLRNGVITLDAQLNNNQTGYFTDDISPEASFASAQKILEGAIPQDIVLNAAKTKAWIAMQGSDQIQQVSIRGGQFRLAKGQMPTAKTAHRPFALALDEQRNEIFSADWGGEVLEVFDSNTGVRKQSIDLGYAAEKYPATNIEKGEFFFYNTAWSNNKRKACAHCHLHELLLDGIPFGNGATGPTEPHKVPANFNLLTTDAYFWNGSLANGTYASLASDAQSRTNCEMILFGEIEGITSNAATRVGDPNNQNRSAQDSQCRPVFNAGAGILPSNFAQISTIIANERQIRDTNVKAATGLGFLDVARLTDFYSVSELRVPPNPLTYLNAQAQLDAATSQKIAHGQQVFMAAGCPGCHDPQNSRHPYTDGINHGSGNDWAERFIETYQTDPRLTAIIATGIPQNMQLAVVGGSNGHEINVHLDPIDFFEPFCFDNAIGKCLVFDDPLAARGNNALETDRLNTLVQINLADPARGFVPGNVRGAPISNTPSLRGLWMQTNFLRTGFAHTLNETILGPGHAALKPGETGYAVDALGNLDVHGTTSQMSSSDVDDLYLFLTSIE